MMRRQILTVVLLGCVLALPMAAGAQDLDASELLPDSPWDDARFQTPEGAADWELLQPDGGDASPVARVHVTVVPANHWEVGFSWDTVAPVAAGDTLVLSYEARADGEKQPPGRVHLALRRVARPYHHSIGDSFRVGAQWKQYRIPIRASVDMVAGGGTLRINLGTQQQTVEMRNLSLKNYGGEMSYLATCRMLDINPSSGGRQPVGRHLTPDLLWEMRVFDDLAEPDPDFDPSGAWEQTWRIWTCYGYINRANDDLGVLRIARTPGEPITLQVEQDQVNTEGQRHVQSAEIACAPDAIATPQRWEYTSQFIGPEGEEMEGLRLEESVQQPPEGPVAAHWGLFEAVQRLPFDKAVEYNFDLLDCLTARKFDHTLRYDGVHEIRFGTDTRTLHRFVQIGYGVLPFEYWLDENHQLVLAISEYRVYVLDPAADEAFTAELQRQQRRYERNKERFAPDTEDDDGE